MKWIKAQRCIAAHHGCVGEMQNAHTENGGMGRKGPYTSIVPACVLHHHEMHDGVETFQRRYSLDLKALAAEWQAAWLTYTGVAA